MSTLLRHGDPLLIFGATTYFAFDVAALGCAFEAFGGGGPPVGVFVLAYTLGHAGAFLPTPGGVGGVEGGLIGMFVVYGAPIGLAATAVLAYRVFQLGLPAVFGAISLLRIRHVLAHPPPREEVAARFAGHHWSPRNCPRLAGAPADGLANGAGERVLSAGALAGSASPSRRAAERSVRGLAPAPGASAVHAGHSATPRRWLTSAWACASEPAMRCETPVSARRWPQSGCGAETMCCARSARAWSVV